MIACLCFVVNVRDFISSICTGYCISTCKGIKENLCLLQIVTIFCFTPHVLWCWVWAVLCQWEQGHFVQPRPLCCPHPARLRRWHCSWSMSPAAWWKSSPDSEPKSLKITGKRKIPSHNSGQLSVTPMEMLSLEVAMPCMSSCGQDASAAITRLGLKAANRSHLIIIYSVTL